MARIAVIGSGPGAFYSMKYLLKHQAMASATVDVLEKLKVPFGLVRFGVAPDHAEVKEVASEFSNLLRTHRDQLKLFVGQDANSELFKRLRESSDAVLVATGAQESRRLPFKYLPPNTLSAREFVMWYNGHPEFADLNLPQSPRHVSVVGHGNVALDVARMLSKSTDELEPLVASGLLSREAFNWFSQRQSLSGKKSVSIIGRRGYLDAAFTNKEFRELTAMRDATCKIAAEELEAPIAEVKLKAATDRAKARGVSLLEKCIANASDESKSNSIFLRFNCKPLEYKGDPAESLLVQRAGDNQIEPIACDMGIESIGFKVSNAFGLPIDPQTGGIANDGFGRVTGFPGVYVAGWAKRGPRGVIAANIPCCVETAEAMFADLMAPNRTHRPTQDPPSFSGLYTPS